ncbi:MAG TPA: Holliday junction resolvase RuvX [Vicinamibacteria bacterium]
MRLLGLDVGDVRIGVALSDDTATIAGGLPTLTRVGPRKDVQAVGALVREHEVAEVVVGLPRKLDGTLGPQAEKVQTFAADLRRSLRIPVHEWDERFTSAEATRTLIEGGVRRRDRKLSVDKVAAVLILQGYLDHRRLASPRESPG